MTQLLLSELSWSVVLEKPCSVRVPYLNCQKAIHCSRDCAEGVSYMIHPLAIVGARSNKTEAHTRLTLHSLKLTLLVAFLVQ